MTSFGWKRKVGEKVVQEATTSFSKNSKDEEDCEADVDWLNLLPKNKSLKLEDNIGKSKRLKKEGIILAEAERFWEAITKWDEAIVLTPTDATLYEMKAQALINLNELFPALTVANKVIEIDSLWWVGYQTLGRAHLNMGEVKMAIKDFSRAIHMNPGEKELWEDDLNWARELLTRKTESEKKSQLKESSVTITEISDNCDNEENNPPSISDTERNTENKLCVSVLTEKIHSNSGDNNMKSIPNNYVQMRDG